MKPLFTLLLLITCLSLVAQDQYEIRAYTGAAFGSNLAVGDSDFAGGDRGFKTGIGLNAGLEFFVVDGISVNLGMTKYFRSGGNQLLFGVGNRNYFYESLYINLNGKYYLDSGLDWLQTYGLLGIVRFTSDYRVQGEFSRPATNKIGLNIGVGAILITEDWWNLLVEYRYSTPHGAQDTPSGGSSIFTLGLLYMFD
ncbi:MAG: outer membrane beta-barrel protein [Cytophagales bacterium]|nr:outer membrane beta-barrel protein [Cytophagales bacterium]